LQSFFEEASQGGRKPFVFRSAAVSHSPPAMTATARLPWHRILSLQVLIVVGLGIAVGHFFPGLDISLEPLGDAFA